MNTKTPIDPDSDADKPSVEFASALEAFDLTHPPAGEGPGVRAEVEVGAKVRGKVISVGEEHALVDFGGRSEGVAETRQFRNEDGTVKIAVGDVVDLFVVEAGDQILLAPALRADPKAALAQLRAARAAGVPVAGRVTGLNSGGLAVDVAGVRCFCPISQIEAGFCAEPAVHVGHTLDFLVTSVEEGRGGAVLSRRQLLRRAEEEQAKLRLATLKPGDELDGKVVRLEAFGAFVDLGGVDGLVHVSEIRHERTGHPKEALKPGEKVRVRVIRIDTGKDGRPRIALSIKAGTPDPWGGIETRFAAGARVEGVVARLADFGAFVTLAPGIDGLVHVSEIAHQRTGHPRDVLTVGQAVEAVVLAVDPEKKRISLSIRQTIEAPVREVSESAPAERIAESGAPREGRPRRDRGARESRPPREAASGSPRGERGGSPRRERPAPGRERGASSERRERPVGARESRASAPRTTHIVATTSAAGGPAELTTMAIALRKAMEAAKQKNPGG